MSVIQSKRESMRKEDHVNQVMSLLEPVLLKEEISKITPWIPEIEEKACELVQQLGPNATKVLHPMAVASAALYDSFLHFESRSRTPIVFSRFKIATNLSVHRIQKVWKKFFDNRVYLDIRRLTPIDVSDSDTPRSIILRIIDKIREALVEVTAPVDEWLSSVESEATDIVRDPSFESEEAPELIAAASVYEGANRHHGKKLVHLPHRILGRMTGWGEAKVARFTKETFSTS